MGLKTEVVISDFLEFVVLQLDDFLLPFYFKTSFFELDLSLAFVDFKCLHFSEGCILGLDFSFEQLHFLKLLSLESIQSCF